MSAKQRADAEALRSKYARCFGVLVDEVEIELLEDEDARVFHRTDTSLPSWRLGTTERASVHATIAEWNEKTGSRWRAAKRDEGGEG